MFGESESREGRIMLTLTQSDRDNLLLIAVFLVLAGISHGIRIGLFCGWWQG